MTFWLQRNVRQKIQPGLRGTAENKSNLSETRRVLVSAVLRRSTGRRHTIVVSLPQLWRPPPWHAACGELDDDQHYGGVGCGREPGATPPVDDVGTHYQQVTFMQLGNLHFLLQVEAQLPALQARAQAVV